MGANLLAFAEQQNIFRLVTKFYKLLKALLRLHLSSYELYLVNDFCRPQTIKYVAF